MIQLDLKATEKRPATRVIVRIKPLTQAGSKVLRFYRSERMLHWAIAIPFLVCYVTALILVTIYNPAPHRPLRFLFATLHRASGVSLIVLPPLAVLANPREFAIHWYNVKQAWKWGLDDFKWILLMPLAVFSSRIRLPEQGKFNAAEKVNFMVLMATYPLYIFSGLLIWLKTFAFLAWVLHFGMAVVATPLIFGHMYMAMIDRGGRVGLSGMFSGFVDKTWARHHYGRWFREQFDEPRDLADIQ